MEGIIQKERAEKEAYRKTSGIQETQWSKGKQPVLTPPNFIETNLIAIEDLQFVLAIAERYGVSKKDIFLEYQTRIDENGKKVEQSRILLRQIENILTQEKRYRFVIKGDSEEDYFYLLDGIEITDETAVQAVTQKAENLSLAGEIYQVCASFYDRYTQREYTVLEGVREELQIAETTEGIEPELLYTRPYITVFEERAMQEQKDEKYYAADLEIPMKEKENKKEELSKISFFDKMKEAFQRIFSRNKPKELPAPTHKDKLASYRLDPDKYSPTPEEMSETAKERLLADLAKNGRKSGKEREE